MLFTL
ncbi:uncharacterized protein FFB14_11070 [Fusarium fujikuroi]